jgi:hypothetical protein
MVAVSVLAGKSCCIDAVMSEAVTIIRIVATPAGTAAFLVLLSVLVFQASFSVMDPVSWLVVLAVPSSLLDPLPPHPANRAKRQSTISDFSVLLASNFMVPLL